MKKFLTPLLLCGLTSSLLAGASTGGPFANGAYYAGYLNGKYQAAVTGNNIIGVVGFALTDGAPPTREVEVQTANAGGPVLRNIQLGVDQFQNYFLIFHEGRTYQGTTTAMIDLDANTVTGALQGSAPATSLVPFTASGTVADALPVVNRGLSGGFQAKIKKKQAVFTFSGTGQLSTPANRQTVNMSTLPIFAPGVVPPPIAPNTVTNVVASGIVATESSPFNIRGIRTSGSASNAVSSATTIR